MEIDIQDVKYICQCQWGACQNMLSYWQEIGRAGRDGMAAKAILMDYRYGKKKFDDDMAKFLEVCRTGNIKRFSWCR
jgi:superfamily II DNA helicase RecQ